MKYTHSGIPCNRTLCVEESRYVLDVHTHTVASGHAYSTIREMADMASKKGVELLGITEHAPHMPGTCHNFYFSNLKAVPRQINGVELLMGVELNIIDSEGHVDLDESMLMDMDVTIASLHPPCYNSGSVKENTLAFLNVLKNPYVDIIGHPDDDRFKIDYDTFVCAVKENGKLIEVNNSSLKPQGPRKNAANNYHILLDLCKKYNQPIILGSDAHIDVDILNFDRAQKVLDEVSFPEDLIINDSVDKLKKYVNKYRRK